jgi:threonine/homoserine/homoserine lactone efflux protein
LRKLLARERRLQAEVSERRRLSNIFGQGVLVNLLNPKTALFFLAFLPQFVDVSKGAVARQILILGLIFVALGIFSDGLYALLAGTVGRWLKGSARYLRAERYFAGSVYIGLGLATAISGSNKSK